MPARTGWAYHVKALNSTERACLRSKGSTVEDTLRAFEISAGNIYLINTYVKGFFLDFGIVPDALRRPIAGALDKQLGWLEQKVFKRLCGALGLETWWGGMRAVR